MSAHTKPSDNLIGRERNNRGNGRFLWPIWAGWVIVLLLVVGLFAASLPYAVFDVKYTEWQVQVARPVAATIFPTYDAFVTYLLGLRLSAVAVFWGTAVYLVWRKPKEWMVIYVSATLLMMSYMLVFQSDMDRWRFPAELVELFPAVEWIAPTLFLICFFLLFYLFPDGRFFPKWIGLLGVAVTGISILIFRQLGTILSVSEEAGWLLFVFSIFLFALIGLISQAIKWRKATVVEKQQTRLVLFALGLLIAWPFIQSIIGLLVGDDPLLHFLSLHLFLIGATLIPITIGISILRFRLWQMDVLLNRTLVYGGATAVILLLYVFVVGATGALFRENSNLLVAVLMTGFVAVLFEPLRRWLQSSVNRLMYGQRDDPMTVIAALGKQLEQTAVPSETLPSFVETIAKTLKLPYVAVAHKRGDEFHVVAATGVVLEAGCQIFPLVYQSQSIGQLLVAPRGAGEPFNRQELRLLRNIARQLGTAVYATQLTTDLQHSREQLVTAREEERRRLRRELHDDLGPQLATLSLKPDAARNQLAYNPEAGNVLFEELKYGLQRALNDIRRVAHDLRPPALDQLGLLSAIREVATQNSVNGLAIMVEAPDVLPSLAAAVEVATYRIIVEAITNCVRHAQAKVCKVSLALETDLKLEIRDNGCGLPAQFPAGVGLASMQERTAELGGSFQIKSAVGAGTAIIVHLPCV